MPSTKQTINNLWDEFRIFINTAYATGSNQTSNLRDYADDISWNDKLNALLDREYQHERKHRGNRPAVRDFSVATAAKLLVMQNAYNGACRTSEPLASDYLILRDTGFEAIVIGWLARVQIMIADDWKKAILSLDYVKLMQS